MIEKVCYVIIFCCTQAAVAEYQYAICLELLCKLLYPRGFGSIYQKFKGKNNIINTNIITSMQYSVDVDAAVSTIEQSAPYIITLGHACEENF